MAVLADTMIVVMTTAMPAVITAATVTVLSKLAPKAMSARSTSADCMAVSRNSKPKSGSAT